MALAAATVLFVGCGKAPVARFELNLQGRDPAEFYPAEAPDEAAAKQAERRDQVIAAISTALTALFGTPDDPYVFPESGLDLKKLQLAAGPYGRDAQGMTHGLYRQHCVHCHGVSGDGAGPTALFLRPYPRDYREGKFKFKSTERWAMPTHGDLKRVLIDGVPGTAMPSFALLPDNEVEALVEYVKYLSIRGQTEQMMLFTWLVNEEDIDLSADNLLQNMMLPVVEPWQQAESQVIVPSDRPAVDTPELLAASIASGKELFMGAKSQCTKCHGPTALGDGSDEQLFDDWNKDKNPEHPNWWLLPKQDLEPRNLRLGIYRGGRRPVDIYRRIHAGINGGPMPGAGPPGPGQPAVLQPDEIWQIVDYVLSLPYEPMSEPARFELTTAQRSQM